jgi:tetratricopeptide (TPR) repeat protein
MMRVSVAVAAFLMALGVAQADPASQKRADELFAEGRKLIEKHDDIGACGKFNEAIKLDPDAAGTMLNLGLCNQNLEKYRLALYWFRKAQARAHETNLPEYEQAAGQRTKDLVGLVAVIKIELSATTPADAHVTLDGDEISPADYLHVEIDTGHHTIEAHAAGHLPSRQELDVEGKGGNTVTIHLVAGDDTMVVDQGAGRRKIAIITAATGGALMITSGIISLVARNRYKKILEDNPTIQVGTPCPDGLTAQCNQANDEQKLASHWGTPMFIAGAALVGIATYVYLTAPQAERVQRTAFVPTVSPDGIGLVAVGRF